MLDAYSKQNKIRIGTSKIVKELQLTKEGRLLMSSLEHVETKKEYVQGDGNSTDGGCNIVCVNGNLLC